MSSVRLSGQHRVNLAPGQLVSIVLKVHQSSGLLTEGFVEEILTSTDFHPHGCKVRLTSGEVGRVVHIIPLDTDEPIPVGRHESETQASERRAEARSDRWQMQVLQQLYGDPQPDTKKKVKRK